VGWGGGCCGAVGLALPRGCCVDTCTASTTHQPRVPSASTHCTAAATHCVGYSMVPPGLLSCRSNSCTGAIACAALKSRSSRLMKLRRVGGGGLDTLHSACCKGSAAHAAEKPPARAETPTDPKNRPKPVSNPPLETDTTHSRILAGARPSGPPITHTALSFTAPSKGTVSRSSPSSGSLLRGSGLGGCVRRSHARKTARQEPGTSSLRHCTCCGGVGEWGSGTGCVGLHGSEHQSSGRWEAPLHPR